MASAARSEPILLRVVGAAIDLTLIAIGLGIIALVFVNVLSRFFLNVDIAWNTEFGEFLLVWGTFLGGAAAARRGGHMRVTEIIGALPERARLAVEIATRAGACLLLIALAWYGFSIVATTMGQEMSVLYWPVGLQYAALPVGALLTLLYVGADLVGMLRGRDALAEAPADL